MKTLRLLLCLVLVLAMVMMAGCGTGGSDSSTGETGNDSGKETIEIVSWWDETPVAGQDELADRKAKRLADVENKYNVKFKYTVLPADEISTKFTTEVLAGGSLGDFVTMRHYWAFPEYAKKGFLLNMSDYFDFSSDDNFNKDDTKIATYDGDVYGFSMETMRVGDCIVFNKALFEKYNIPNPYDLYETGEWTWDYVLDIAKKLTIDGRDGTKELWGINSLDKYDVVELIVASHGGTYVSYVNGAPKSDLTHTGTIKGIELAYKATYVDKVCEPYPSGADWDYALKQFMSGKTAMLITSSSSFDDLKANMSDKYGIMPLPLGEGQTEYVNFIRERHMKVASHYADKARMEKLLPILYEYYTPFEDYSDIEKQNFEIYTWDKESVNICLDLVKKQYIPEYYNFGSSYWNIVVTQGLNKAMSGQMTATAAMKAIDDAWQATISK